jgi:DNA mismatch repair protein MutS
MGDFYEMFRDDAVTAARVLGLTLTARNKGAPDEIPMAGVPWHAAHGYVAKLLAAGFKIALCEQMADPAKCKGIVPREVVRVLTPSLVTEGDQLDARENQFLAAIDVPESDDVGLGLALLDLSTGELLASVVDGVAVLAAEIARAEPRELLVGGDARRASEIAAAVRLIAPKVAVREDAALDPADVDATLDGAAEVPIAAEARRSGLDAGALVAAARALPVRACLHAAREAPGAPRRAARARHGDAHRRDRAGAPRDRSGARRHARRHAARRRGRDRHACGRAPTASTPAGPAARRRRDPPATRRGGGLRGARAEPRRAPRSAR